MAARTLLALALGLATLCCVAASRRLLSSHRQLYCGMAFSLYAPRAQINAGTKLQGAFAHLNPFAFEFPVYDSDQNTTKVGYFAGQCTLLTVTYVPNFSASNVCMGTMVLNSGTFAVQGILGDDGPTSGGMVNLAIVGGTGPYNSVQGQLQLKNHDSEWGGYTEYNIAFKAKPACT